MKLSPSRCGNGNGSSKVAKSSSEFKRDVRPAESAPAVHIYFSRKMLIILAILLISPCLIVSAALSYSRVFRAGNKPLSTRSDAISAHTIQGNPGPWGRVLYVHVMIDIPDEFVILPPSDQPPVRWFFKDYSKEKVIELLKSADISQVQIDNLLPDSAWKSEDNGTWLTPGDELILSLSPEARSKIYSILVAYSENSEQMDPVWFQPETLDKQLSESGLAESSIKLLKSLLYQNGSKLLLFADKDTALHQIAGDGEKRLFIKTISRKATLMARLKIGADSDVEALAGYWGVGGRHKDVLPLISSIQRVDGGLNMSVVYLLPHFIRDHLYMYPFPSADPQAPKQDCFWSAFNAMSAQPDDRFSDMQFAGQTLIKDYYNIAQPSQLGDLVFLSTADNQAIHAAVYIADDIVFTKNGFHCTQPWILMHLKDMVETYAARLPAGKQLNVLYYRQKNL
ncbi:MAG: hypothetical protein ABSG67_11505 [Thermoguttaceae bacterium]